jgi:hypothetical protein
VAHFFRANYFATICEQSCSIGGRGLLNDDHCFAIVDQNSEIFHESDRDFENGRRCSSQRL